MRRRFLPFLLLAALVAGCGSATKTSSGTGTTPDGAALVGANTLAFISVDSDFGSSQWQQLDALSKKFPKRDELIGHLKQAMSDQGVDYDRDIKPALGPELDVAFVSGGTDATTKAVALTKPTDPARFKALVAKLRASDSTADQHTVYREVDGWYALSDSQAAIAAVLKGGGDALADDDTFKEAMAKLPDDSLVKAYLDGRQLGSLVKKAAARANTGTGLDPSVLGLDSLTYIAASASAEDEGIRFSGALNGGPATGGDFSSKIAQDVPADAFAFLDTDGNSTADQLEKLKSNPQLGLGLAQLETVLGISYDQVLDLLRGEIGFYARPAGGIPELTLALRPDDVSGVLATLDKLVARLALSAHATVRPGTQGGHPVKTIDLGEYKISYGSVADTILLTSGVSGIADFGGSGDRLPDSADFKEAQDASGMPDETGGYFYLDLKDAIPMIESFASLAGKDVPSDVSENLRPLRSFVSWSTRSGDTQTFDAFLEIK
jgi:hypothetical protein